MRINNVCFLQNTPSFKRTDNYQSSYPQQFDDDDSLYPSSALDSAREVLRNNMLYDVNYSSSYMPEYQLKKLEKELDNSTSRYNKMEVSDFKHISKNSYSGPTLAFKPHLLEKAKDIGIKKVIDLVGYFGYDQKCRNNGIEYINFDVNSYFSEYPIFGDKLAYLGNIRNSILQTRPNPDECAVKMKTHNENYSKDLRKTIDDFVNFINAVQEGNFYIGCCQGVSRTNDALMLSSFFNPQNKDSTIYRPTDRKKNNMLMLYQRLDCADKERLGFTPEFEQKLVKKLES